LVAGFIEHPMEVVACVLQAMQGEYSICWRGPEAELLPTLEGLGIGFVSFSPLGAGFLTSKIDENTKFDPTDFRNILPRFAPEARKANMALVEIPAASKFTFSLKSALESGSR